MIEKLTETLLNIGLRRQKKLKGKEFLIKGNTSHKDVHHESPKC